VAVGAGQVSLVADQREGGLGGGEVARVGVQRVFPSGGLAHLDRVLVADVEGLGGQRYEITLGAGLGRRRVVTGRVPLVPSRWWRESTLARDRFGPLPIIG
jgi:hypothetical protein